MKKIKGLLFAFVALFAFTLALATVNAAGEKYGVYTVSEAGKKAEWDFTQNVPSANVTVKNLTDESLNGLGGDSSKGVTFKSSDKKISNNTSGTIYVPMPSDDAAGTITLVGNRSGDRYVTVNGVATAKINDDKTGASYTFTSSELATESGKVWLKLTPGDGEVKIGSITVVLTNGEYAATATKITVTLKDASEKVLRTDATVDSGSAYEKGYVAWGFDTTGYFLDNELTQAYDNSELTEDTTLYVGLNAWDGVIANPNNLTNELVSKLNGVELGDTYPLTGTIYTLLPNTSYATTSGNPCITVSGAVAQTEKGVQLVVETAGTLTVQMTTGGGSARAAKVINASSGSEIAVASGEASWDATAAGNYEVRTLTYALEAGTYNVGGNNGMRILSMEFTPEVQSSPINLYQFADLVGDTEVVRYVGIVEGFTLEEVTGNYTLVLNCDLFENGTFDITDHCQIADHLTLGGETYTEEINGESFEFGVKDNVLYVVCVVAVANDGNGLANQYAGHEITATLSVPVLDFSTTTNAYAVQGQQ